MSYQEAKEVYAKIGVDTEQAIEKLKNANVWVYAADMDGEPMGKANLKGDIALVVGGEGTGVKELTRKDDEKYITLLFATRRDLWVGDNGKPIKKCYYLPPEIIAFLSIPSLFNFSITFTSVAMAAWSVPGCHNAL